MNKLNKILSEIRPTLSYRIKFANEPTKEELSKVLNLLDSRYDAFEVGALKKTIFHVKPVDFYNLDCGEIWMFDFKTQRGIQDDVLTYEIGSLLKWPETFIHVRNNDTAYQQELAIQEDGEDLDFDEYEPKLLDPEYKDAPEINVDDYTGQKHTDKVVKDAVTELEKNPKPYSKYFSAGFKGE